MEQNASIQDLLTTSMPMHLHAYLNSLYITLHISARRKWDIDAQQNHMKPNDTHMMAAQRTYKKLFPGARGETKFLMYVFILRKNEGLIQKAQIS